MTSPLRKQHIAPHIERIVLIGTGGTGSYLAQGLAKMIAGYRLQVEVTLVDPDVIEEKNCSRQNFHPWEIGQHKAEALAYRLNQQYGLAWAHVVGKGEDCPKLKLSGVNAKQEMKRLIITCVDTISARKPYRDNGPWLDLGNGLEVGQAYYGTTSSAGTVLTEEDYWYKRPTVGHLPGPWLLAGMKGLKDPRKKTVSCADTPFAEQGAFVNEWAAQAGLTILHQLLVKGSVSTPAIYFDASRGRMNPEYITREYLSRVTTKEIK